MTACQVACVALRAQHCVTAPAAREGWAPCSGGGLAIVCPRRSVRLVVGRDVERAALVTLAVVTAQGAARLESHKIGAKNVNAKVHP